MTTKPRTKLPTESLTINQIAERYPDKWILLRVTDYDGYGRSAAGQVVAVGNHSQVAWNRLLRLRRQGEGDHSHYFIFNAFAHLDSGQGWKETLENVDLSRLPRGLR
jgi:hypothetical protein